MQVAARTHVEALRDARGEQVARDERVLALSTDLSIITCGLDVYWPLEAAERVDRENNLSKAVRDLRALAPRGRASMRATVVRADDVLVLHEGKKALGI